MRPQLAGFWDSFGNLVGNVGNSTEAGNNAAMYANPNTLPQFWTDPNASLFGPDTGTPGGSMSPGSIGGYWASLLPIPSMRTILLLTGGAIILASLLDSD